MITRMVDVLMLRDLNYDFEDAPSMDYRKDEVYPMPDWQAAEFFANGWGRATRRYVDGIRYGWDAVLKADRILNMDELKGEADE